MPHLSCCDNEIAEQYAMNQLDSLATDALEEHLLVCSPCVGRVEEATEYVAVFRTAAVECRPSWIRIDSPSV